jgi:uncharacterized membrane-anchored protein
MQSLRMMEKSLWIFLFLFAATFLLRADPDPAPAKPTRDSLAAIASTLKWQTGTITLKDDLAKINLTDQFRFIGQADAQKVLHDIWGNPPDPSVLGMIFPSKVGPLDGDSWGILIEYEESGYVKDDDASKINYTDLLKQMQQDTVDGNAEREKAGYPVVTLVGWATPPHYDATTHKLYWAKDIRFGSGPDDTLNYNIRILGRRGVLFLNAIASMRQYPTIDQQMPQVLSMVDFQTGNQYADFDPKVDKIAKYGLATLVAGGVLGAAAKFGAFKFLWPVLLFLKKFIIVALLAVGASLKKISAWFKGRSAGTSQRPPS